MGETLGLRSLSSQRAKAALAVALIVGALIAWQIIASAVAAVPLEPKTVLSWRADDPDALVEQAGRAFVDGEFEQAGALARAAVKARPFTAPAVRILGQTAAFQGDEARAERLLLAANRLTHRDAELASLLFEQALRQGRYDQALEQGDVLIRRAPPAAVRTITRLSGLVRQPAAVPALERSLAENPFWRLSFFRRMAADERNYGPGAALALSLTQSAHPPTPDELAPLLNRLVWAGRAAEARTLWLATLPPRDRPRTDAVYNPRFIDKAAAPPFGWTYSHQPGTEVTVSPDRGSGGLYVRNEGLAGGEAARQVLPLSPGRYALSSRATLLDGRGVDLRWQLACGGVRVGPALTMQPERSGSSEEVDVDVPASCGLATLSLQTLGGDHSQPTLAVVHFVELKKVAAP